MEESNAYAVDQGALRLGRGFADAVRADPALLLRAVLAAAVERLHVPHETAEALRAAARDTKGLSARARRETLLALLLAPAPAEALDAASRYGMLAALAPEVQELRAMPRGAGRYKDVYQHTLRVVDATPADPLTRLAALLHDIAKPETLTIENGEAHFPNHDALGADKAARRLRALRFDSGTVGAVETLVRLHLRANSYEADWTDSAVRRLCHDAGDQWQRLLDLSHADVTSARPELVNRARRRVQELGERARAIDQPAAAAPLDGLALMERTHRGPGRWIGEVKAHLLQLIAAGKLDASDRDAAWSAVEAFLACHPPP